MDDCHSSCGSIIEPSLHDLGRKDIERSDSRERSEQSRRQWNEAEHLYVGKEGDGEGHGNQDER